MSGEPTKPKSADVTSAKAGADGSLPDSKPSVSEDIAAFVAKARALGMLKVPVFMFQEGHDETAEQAFREIARLTGGAWCRFDPGAAAQLRELLRAAAAYAAGGREALLRLSKSGSGAAKLLGQMK